MAIKKTKLAAKNKQQHEWYIHS